MRLVINISPVVVFCPLPVATNIESHDFNPLSTNVLNDSAMPLTFVSATTPGQCDVASTSYIPPPSAKESLSSTSGRNVLESMFFSHRTVGVKASIFTSPESSLRASCLLHGLTITCLSNVREVRTALLSHIVNGDCFTSRCAANASASVPDRTACLCIAKGFSSSFAM